MVYQLEGRPGLSTAVVKKEEVLGYRIYRYNRKTGTVTFA